MAHKIAGMKHDEMIEKHGREFAHLFVIVDKSDTIISVHTTKPKAPKGCRVFGGLRKVTTRSGSVPKWKAFPSAYGRGVKGDPEAGGLFSKLV